MKVRYEYLIVVVTSLFLLYSCKPKSGLNDKLTSQIFSKDQIIELKKILSFFDNEVCIITKSESKDIKVCYNLYFKRLASQTKENNEINLNVPIQQQDSLIASLNPDLINEIWIKNNLFYNKKMPVTGREGSKDTLDVLVLNTNGKYLNFIKELSMEDSKVQFYFSTFGITETISPSLVFDLIKNYDEYDILDERIRLIVAIHYLTLNKQFNEIEKSDSS